MRLIALLVDIDLGPADVRLAHGAVAAAQVLVLSDIGMAGLTLRSVVAAIGCQDVLLLLELVMNCPFLECTIIVAHGVLPDALLQRRLIALALRVDLGAVRVGSPLRGAIEGVSEVNESTIGGLLFFLRLLFAVAI